MYERPAATSTRWVDPTRALISAARTAGRARLAAACWRPADIGRPAINSCAGILRFSQVGQLTTRRKRGIRRDPHQPSRERRVASGGVV